MARRQHSTTNRSLLAFLAGAMFFLAGAIETVTGWSARGSLHGGLLSTGVMFLCVGALWIAVGAKWKKADTRSAD